MPATIFTFRSFTIMLAVACGVASTATGYAATGVPTPAKSGVVFITDTLAGGGGATHSRLDKKHAQRWTFHYITDTLGGNGQPKK